MPVQVIIIIVDVHSLEGRNGEVLERNTHQAFTENRGNKKLKADVGLRYFLFSFRPVSSQRERQAVHAFGIGK